MQGIELSGGPIEIILTESLKEYCARQIHNSQHNVVRVIEPDIKC